MLSKQYICSSCFHFISTLSKHLIANGISLIWKPYINANSVDYILISFTHHHQFGDSLYSWTSLGRYLDPCDSDVIMLLWIMDGHSKHNIHYQFCHYRYLRTQISWTNDFSCPRACSKNCSCFFLNGWRQIVGLVCVICFESANISLIGFLYLVSCEMDMKFV